MAKRSYQERIKEAQEKAKAWKAVENKLKAQEKAAEEKKEKSKFNKEFAGDKKRRARTHRLCQVGGTIEKVLKRELTQEGDIERLADFLSRQEEQFRAAMMSPVAKENLETAAEDKIFDDNIDQLARQNKGIELNTNYKKHFTYNIEGKDEPLYTDEEELIPAQMEN